MDRFRASFWTTPLRALLLGLGAAALWLHAAGFTADTFLHAMDKLMSDIPELRAYAREGANSLGLIVLALVTGLSFALALAILLNSFGQRIAKTAGWAGRLLADVTPVAWGFATMLLLARGLELPILGLLPDTSANQTQSWEVLAGQQIWKWMVPAITLAIPVFGFSLYSLTHQISAWQQDPDLGKLKARGISRSVIFYRYLMPRVVNHLVHLALPAWGLVMLAAIPVEKMLGFEGWGQRLSNTLLQNDAPGTALSFVLGGLLLALGCLLIRYLEPRGSTAEKKPLQDASRFQNKGAGITGLILAGALVTLPQWLPLPQWRIVQHAHEAWWPEVSLALLSSLAALAAIFFYSFAMSLSRKDPGRRKTRLVALIRFTVRFAVMGGCFFLLKGWGFAGAVVGAVVLHGLVKAHVVLKEMYASDRVLSARSIGRATYGIWRHHVLSELLPSLLHWIFWNTANVLSVVTLIRFCVPAAAGTTSWGQQMQLAADGILEAPLPALAPALMLALWCLSFRLISRAFPVRTPSLPTSPFVTR